MDKITHKQIEKLTATLNKQRPAPEGHHYHSEFASVYGGWRLVMVGERNGAHYGAFGQSSCCERVSTREFYQYLSGLLN